MKAESPLWFRVAAALLLPVIVGLMVLLVIVLRAQSKDWHEYQRGCWEMKGHIYPDTALCVRGDRILDVKVSSDE